jgi:hypothetical protein
MNVVAMLMEVGILTNKQTEKEVEIEAKEKRIQSQYFIACFQLCLLVVAYFHRFKHNDI